MNFLMRLYVAVMASIALVELTHCELVMQDKINKEAAILKDFNKKQAQKKTKKAIKKEEDKKNRELEENQAIKKREECLIEPSVDEEDNNKVLQENKEKADKNSDDKENKEKDKKDSKDKDNKDNKKDKEKDEKKVKKEPLYFASGDSDLRTWIRLRLPEFFYGKNLRLLNNNNLSDRILYFRHTLDFNTEYRYGLASRGYDVALIKMTIRNKGVWGDPESIGLTTEAETKELDSVFGPHRHAIPRLFPWIRELWLQLSLNDLLCLPFCNYHTITFGAFPFELGRGIALGSTYATDPSDIGFFGENAVDQYAFGGKISGDLIKNYLTYDIYGSILDSKCNSFDHTNARIKGQCFGHRNDQARGFGIINYIIAGRLKLNFAARPNAKIRVEPYALYNRNPEHKIEFRADGRSSLVTLGIACEAEVANIEFGFDTAFNRGQQTAFGWDRNTTKLENRDGKAAIVNSRVRQAPQGQTPDPRKSPLALKVQENQDVINASIESGEQNGKIIGSNSLGTLVNDIHRFTNPYVNKFRGFMFVCDMSYIFIRPDFKVSATYGFASGGENPNRDLQEKGDSEYPFTDFYDGFISLQETYQGVRVKSAFLLGGNGKIPRLLSFPSEEVLDPFASPVSRFTNLVFGGAGFTWKPSWSCRKWSVNPNIIAFWQNIPTRFFNKKFKDKFGQQASKFLGTEIDAFIESEVMDDLRFFFIGALFIPGRHFKDVKGLPLNKAQQTFVDNQEKQAIINDRQPLLGEDLAYFVNLGLEFRF